MKAGKAITSLRGRVALVATATVAGVLVLVGAGALASFAERENDRVDEALLSRPAPDLVRALRGFDGPPVGEVPPGAVGPPDSGLAPPVLRPQGEYVRLIVDGNPESEVDAPDGLSVPDETGLRTVEVAGNEYRSLTREVAPGVVVEVGQDLSEASARIAELRDRLLLVGLAGVLLVAALSWWLAGLALRPLARLRDAAGSVGTTDDLSTRIDPGSSPVEIEELTSSINAMLARLQLSAAETSEALEATRRFAADAGHELRTPMTSLQANLGLIRRNPEIETGERDAALEQMDREAARMMRMLTTLQTLARGDAAAALPREPVELCALVGNAVESAGRRHGDTSWALDTPPGEVEVEGWPDGLRAMVDNLLENAARHGRAGGEVRTTVSAEGGEVRVTVDDDGPGIPAGDREQVFERFRRGDTVGSDGSGLGLSLVRQQARLHGGDVSVGESPAGGASFEVRLG